MRAIGRIRRNLGSQGVRHGDLRRLDEMLPADQADMEALVAAVAKIKANVQELQTARQVA